MARAQAAGGGRHGTKEHQGEDHPAHQEHLRLQVPPRPRGRRLPGPHGPHHHQRSQPPHLHRLPPAVPHQPPRGGQAAAGRARAGEEALGEGAGGMLAEPQGRSRVAHAALGPVGRVGGGHLLRRGRAAGQHALLGLHQGHHDLLASQHGATEQRVPVGLHPPHQHQQADRIHAEEAEEEEVGQGLPGAAQVEVQGDQG